MRITPATVLAFVAVLLTLSGGAYAAKKIRSKDIGTGAVASRAIKNSSIQTKDLHRSVRSALARRGRTGPRGATGARGATGPRGYRGYRGYRGATGPQGPAGPMPDALPGGRTLRGAYVVAGTAGAADSELEASETFAFALGSAPAVHFVAAGGPAPGECPGNATSPSAAAGHLCVYEADRGGVLKAVTIFDPGQAKAAGAGRAGRFGFGVRVVADAAGAIRSTGTWAVTAP